MTLIELLVVVAVVGILTALIIPVTGRLQSGVKSTKCISNLRAIGVAMNAYASENDNLFPHAYGSAEGDQLTWMWKTAPYMGMPEDVMGPDPKPRAIGVFVCPEYDMKPDRVASYGLSRYIDSATSPSGNRHWNYRRAAVSPAKTILVAEIEVNNEFAYAERIVRRHPNVSANYLFVDGHVENLDEIIPASDSRWFNE